MIFIFITFCLSSQNQQEWGQVKNAQDPRDPNLLQVRWPLQTPLQVQALQDEAGRCLMLVSSHWLAYSI